MNISILNQSRFGGLLSTILLILMLLPELSIGQVPARKNIDELTQQELKAYEHAIQIMYDRSIVNPYDKEGYAWQAWVHNRNSVEAPADSGFTIQKGSNKVTDFFVVASKTNYPHSKTCYPGMCEHGKDLFLMWHRAEFYYFEQILRNADPDGTIKDSKGNVGPSTKNVSVPYWNFTRKPSGKRFPIAFEKESSVLHHKGRNTEAVNFPYTSPYLLAHQIYNYEWPEFAGYPNATTGGFGIFESMIHNPMHAVYVGGDMDDTAYAAYDPIFFSFHSYIDLILEKYIQEHGKDVITSLNYQLRGDQPAKYNLPGYDPGRGKRPTMGRAALYPDIAKLNYRYEQSSLDEFVSKKEVDKLLRGKDNEFPVFGKSQKSLFALLLANGGQFAPIAEEAELIQKDYPISDRLIKKQQSYLYITDYHGSYQIDVYIHPKAVPLDLQSSEFRNKYLANLGVHWGSVEMSHGSQTYLNINITDAARDLYRHFDGETWQLSANITKL